MQMIKGCELNDPALRKTTALGLFRIRWEQSEKPHAAAVVNAGKGIFGKFKYPFCVCLCRGSC